MSDSAVTLVTDKPHISVEDVVTLFMHAEWAKRRTYAQVKQMIARTDVIVMARRQERPVGLARLITDGVFRAFIEDVIVVPDCRRSGIGRLLVGKVEELVRAMGISRIDLVTTQTGFWEQLGYVPKTGSAYMIKLLSEP